MDRGRGYGTFFKWKVGTKEGLGLEIGWGCYTFCQLSTQNCLQSLTNITYGECKF